MKPKITLLVILLAALFIAFPVQARMDPEQPVPFRARVSAVATPPPNGPPPWGMDVYGSGVASHMGYVTVYQHHFVVPDPSPNVLDFYDGIFIWTAANGDKLEGTYSGQLVFNPTGGYFEIHGYFVTNGGTGRFRHASGEGLASGAQNLDGTALLILNGVISY
jgi:hypothetical protein